MCCALVLSSSAALAQDFHFSQFYNFSSGINPALAGKMKEDIRAGLIYRSQWRQVNLPYSTFGVAADMNFVNVPLFFDKIGAGIVFVNDELPDQIFKNQHVAVSLAMHKSLDAFKRHRISIGLQPGYSRKTFNSANRYSAIDIDRTTYQFNNGASADQGISGINTFGAFNLNAGAFYEFTISDNATVGLGLSMFNITAPKESVSKKDLLNYDPIRLGRRSLGTLNASLVLSSRFTLLPALLFTYQSGAIDFNVGTAVGYHLNDRKDITVFLGGWYRMNDAAIPMIGMQYKHFRGAFTYDATMSSLTALKNSPDAKGRSVGAYEFTLTYVGFLSRALPNDVTVPCKFF